MDITPKTKIGELLDAYPDLENVLIEIAPDFKKLKNPILRKTIAKIATLQQAASIANIPVADLINQLREKAGLGKYAGDTSDTNYSTVPAWFNNKKPDIVFDARPIINSGGHPMKEVFNEAAKLNNAQILNFLTPFLPSPLIDKLKDKGFQVYTVEENGLFNNYVYKP